MFAYKTVNTDVLAWITRRITGETLSAQLSTRIWQPMGAEEDAYYTLDRLGVESGGGGLNTTLHPARRCRSTLCTGSRGPRRMSLPATWRPAPKQLIP